MPTVSQLRQYLSLTVIPVLAGAAANWLIVHAHFLAAFHVEHDQIAGVLTQLGVFALGAGLAFLASHHVLRGSYVPDVPLGPLVVSNVHVPAPEPALVTPEPVVVPPPAAPPPTVA